jgi:GDPmannose 4,6-dehydratase
MNKKALILGVTGQDGSYLSEILLEKGYEVHGVIRRSSFPNTQRIDTIFDPDDRKYLHYGDLSTGIAHDDLLYNIQPDEIYNLAAMSHVRISFDIPVYTLDINATGVCRILEGIRKTGLAKKTKFYQASSSEMFGITNPPQKEDSLFQPVSPLWCGKTGGIIPF